MGSLIFHCMSSDFPMDLARLFAHHVVGATWRGRPAQRRSSTGHGHCKQDPSGPCSCTLVLLLTLRAPEHLLLPVAPGIHRPLAPAHRQRRRYDMPWGDAAGVCHGSREQDPAAPPVLRHLLEGTLARARPCLTSKRPRHASTGFKVGSVSMCAQRRSVDCRPHKRSRGPGGAAAPGRSRGIPRIPQKR